MASYGGECSTRARDCRVSKKGRAFWALWASTPARGNVVAMVSFWAYSGLDEHRGEGGLSGAGAPPYSARVRKGSVSTEGGEPAAYPALFARRPLLRPVFTGCMGSSLRCCVCTAWRGAV